MNKFEKLMMIARRPSLWRAFLGGAVASMEHYSAMRRLKVRTCLDIGANKGQFSALCRHLFPGVKIFAFEPLPEVARHCARALGNGDVKVYAHALGATASTARFYVTERADSSSLLHPGTRQERAYGSRVASALDVEVRRLDQVLTNAQIARPALMKLDVQGAELDVLEGCGALLRNVDYIYLEGSFVELYDGQALITDIIRFLDRHGFAFRGIFNTSYTPDYGTTQADFLFERIAQVDDHDLKTTATVTQPGLVPA